MMSNFQFVYDHYDKSITAPLKEAEKLYWTDYVAAGAALRKVLESWCNRTIEEHNIDLGPKQSLCDKITELYQYYPGEMKDKQYNYIVEEQTKLHNMKIWHYVWRGYGNVCAHDEDWKNPKYPSACFENLSIVFSIVYEFFYYDAMEKNYQNDMPGKITKFLRESKMPIGENTILSDTKSHDPLCKYEFVTESRSDAGTIENYGLVRIFEKENLCQNIQDIAAQTQEYETYLNAINKLNLPSSCLKDMEVLSRMDSENSDFFIVKYKFIKYRADNKPCFLTDTFLKKLSLKQKYTLCRDLAEQLNEYHKAGVYHRNLNYTSIALCDDGNGNWKPSIIKLEYAKNTNSAYTVIERVKNKGLRPEKITKYDDKKISQNPSSDDWKWADIFSLGVLFRDILTETVSMPNLGSMPARAISEEIKELAKAMSSTEIKDRPKLEKVIQAFQTEINKI